MATPAITGTRKEPGHSSGLAVGPFHDTLSAFTPGFALDLARKQGAAIKNGLPGEFAMGTPRLKSDEI